MKKLTSAIAAANVATSELADSNNVEKCWFMRGVLDALESMACGEVIKEDPNNNYYGFYMAGYESVTSAAQKAGV